MSILAFVNDRLAPEIRLQPLVDLLHWRILQRGNGALHLAVQMVGGSLRLTSALMAIDLPHATITTESGRRYRLCAAPEDNEVLRGLITLNAARELVVISGDVSETIWNAVLTGVWSGEMGCLLPPIQ